MVEVNVEFIDADVVEYLGELMVKVVVEVADAVMFAVMVRKCVIKKMEILK